MRLLLDECTPRRLKRDFAGHTIFTVEEAGLKGLKNGRLLRAAVGNYDALITVDRNIAHQQNIASFGVAVVILVAKSNRHEDLKPLVPKALEALKQIKPGEIVEIV